MSARNGDKSRHSVNRKRAIQRRVKSRGILTAHKEKGGSPAGSTPNSQPPTPKEP